MPKTEKDVIEEAVSDEESEELEESVDADEEETDDETSREVEPGEEEELPPDDGYVDDESEYLAQWRDDGLPDEYKSVEDVINAHVKQHREMGDLRTRAERVRQIEDKLREIGFDGGIDGFLNVQVPAQSPTPQYGQSDNSGGQQYQPPTVTASLQRAVQSGEMDVETAQYYRPIATHIDSVFNQIYGAMAEMYRTIGGITNESRQTGNKLRDAEWNAFSQSSKYGQIDRREIDNFRNRHNYPDYETAVRAYMAADPERFQSMMKHLEQGAEKVARKKLRKIGTLRKGKGGQTRRSSSADWKAYQLGDGSINEAKLEADVKAGKLDDKEYTSICDAIIKDIQRRESA